MLMPDWDDDIDDEQGTGVLTDTTQKVEKPPLYKVLLHNDDYTTMEFVVHVLQTIFHRSAVAAVRIMLAVHHQGVGVAGVYTYEIAETKVNQVAQLAKSHAFPLLCTMEEE
jgi:ATP-dependent Clp protease adaptor protein ClpS